MMTSKQESFAQAVASGMTQSDAYRSAYDCENSSDKVIWNEASLLMGNQEVSVRVESLKAELAAKALWTREQSVTVLKGVIVEGDSKAGDKISAVKVLNDMQGFNAPNKLDIAVTFPRVINVIAGRA